MTREDFPSAFIQAKPVLMSIAYRMLGTRKDAEDIVQDVYIRLCETDYEAINNPKTWMTTVCTRLCLDYLKSAEQKRVEYVGTWLPEPLSEEYSNENYLEISASLSTAFVLLLERLTPKERAVYLLREIFDQDYTDVASALDMTEPACRKIFSRARNNIGFDTKRQEVSRETQQRIYNSFKDSVTNGNIDSLKALLSEEIKLSADGGGKVVAAAQVIQGEDDVVNFIAKNLHTYWKGYHWREAKVNGQLGAVISHNEEIHAVASFGYDQAGKLSQILIMRNPDKLTSFTQ